jgi:DNA polymerase/3'-5' exonuclease PolX
MGIRTAARKKIGRTPRMPIATLLVGETAKAIKALHPGIKDLHLVGSRLRHRYGRDLDFVAVTDQPAVTGRNATLRVGDFKVNLFFADKDNVESAILEFGLGLDILRWKRKAIDRGYRLNRYGLWKGKVLVSSEMGKIAALLGLPLKPQLVYTLKHPY